MTAPAQIGLYRRALYRHDSSPKRVTARALRLAPIDRLRLGAGLFGLDPVEPFALALLALASLLVRFAASARARLARNRLDRRQKIASVEIFGQRDGLAVLL